MKTHLKVALFCLAWLISPQVNAAPITLDDLSRTGSVTDDGTVAGGTTLAQGAGAGHAGARTLFAQQTDGAAGTTSLTILGGVLATGNTNNAGASSATYSALGGLDFSAGILQFDVTAASITAGGEIDLDITIDGETVDSGITGTGLFSLDLAAAGFTPANLASVALFQLAFTFDDSESLQIEGNGGIVIQEVPEPASLAVWGVVALSGGVLAYRRRKRNAAA